MSSGFLSIFRDPGQAACLRARNRKSSSLTRREAGWVGCMKQQQAPQAVCGFARCLSPVARRVKAHFFEMQLPELSLLCPLLTGRAIELLNNTGCRSRGAT